MGLPELKADAKLHRARILSTEFDQIIDPAVRTAIKDEFSQNVWPWLEALVGTIQDEVVADFVDLAEAVDELIDQNDGVLQPEHSAKILGVLEIGKLVIAAWKKNGFDELDELAKKRIGELMHAYHQGATIVEELVNDLTLDGDVDLEQKEREDAVENESDDDSASDDDDKIEKAAEIQAEQGD